MDQQAQGQGQQGQQEGDLKAQLEAKDKELSSLKQELEDLRLEVMSPEYMEFLNAQEKGGTPQPSTSTSSTSATDTTITDTDLEKLSKKDLLMKAKELAKQELQAEIEKVKNQGIEAEKERTKKEVAAFARSHEDFETYRPIMYGLSLDPKNADLSLQELYDLAKEHVKRIHTEPSAEEKARQAKLSGEKPGGASESYEELKKLSPEEAAKKALEETKAKLGIEKFPTS